MNDSTIEEVTQMIREIEAKKRSHLLAIKTNLIELGKEQEAAIVIIDSIALSIKSMTAVNVCSQSLYSKIARLADYKIDVNAKQTAMIGMALIDLIARIGLITVKKRNLIVKGKVKPQWILSSSSKDYSEYAKTLNAAKFHPNPNDGPIEWTKPTIETDTRVFTIVKRALRDKMLHNYTYYRMPSVYDAINRLNRQTYVVNRELLDYATDTEATNSFIPSQVTEGEIKDAFRGLNDVMRRALKREEAQFIEYTKWAAEDDAELMPDRKLTKNFVKYIDDASESYKDTIKKHSKRFEYDQVVDLANEWKNGDLNYLYSLDTRGRIYTEQPFFNPLGNDLAKALLVFKDKHELNPEALYLHISNCFGNDKASFQDRMQWTIDNQDDLIAIGKSPWTNWDKIKKLGLDGEKTLWQGLAACIELHKLSVYFEATGSTDGFKSGLPIGLDSTSSGTQILTMLTNDSEVAPYVNLTQSPDGKVGDFYTYLADFLLPKLEKIANESKSLENFLKPDIWKMSKRTVAKRNSMTFNYSGTAFGFGMQHKEDKSSYGKIDQFHSHGDTLTNEDCYAIGRAMYEVCVENIKGSAAMMDFLVKAVKLKKRGPIVSWTLPDGFTAYQKCSKVKSHTGASAMIGDTKVTIRIEYYSDDEGDTYLHKNGIAANWTHSMDSFLLRLIVNNMPLEAPISTVHDMFSTSSTYIDDLHGVAREAYKYIANREVVNEMLQDAFGVDEEIPSVGTWTTDELDNAEFFIC